MLDVLKKIQEIGIVPVVKISRAEDAVPLAKALCEGGLPCAEVTFRTACAAEAIKAMTDAFPEMLVGAGTVLTTAQADAAMAAGAKFLVSPGLNPTVVQYCVEKGYPITPGCSNPSDVEQALSFGLEVVKFFPAEAAGGLPMIKAMSAPYGNLKFMPTGGIDASNLKSYLDFNKIIACGGSWMVKADMIDAGDFDGIRKLTQKAVEAMLGFELLHVGINSENGAQAAATAAMFASLFGFAAQENEGSFFNGTSIEVMKQVGPGTFGHLAIGTNYMDRAVAYLERRGVALNWDSAQYDSKKKLVLIYLKDQVGGFAIHLKQK
jgi:2-dehydro-3-deoxyphosphogluconate aldolase/(4S)-4-hydroxy-2-oxoglutarate aldolase